MRNIRTVPQLLFRIFIRPVFPFLQWLGKVSGVAKHAKTVEGPYRRQPYLIGYLKPGLRMEDVQQELIRIGFTSERVAYPDPGQLVSFRRLDDTHPDQQYHLRIFVDREIRGHLEFTPEDRPIAHMEETLFEERNELFRGWLGELLEEQSPSTHPGK